MGRKFTALISANIRFIEIRRRYGMYLRVVLAIFLLSTMALAEGNLPYPKDGTTIYVVRPGDTLWKISGRFFDNPLFWPRLWDLNQQIDNPSRIYPGDVLSLKIQPPANMPVVKIEPKSKKISFKDIEPPPPVFYYSPGGSEGFISSHRWKHMGTILTSEPPKILLGTGDIVFTNVGSEQGVSVGDKFTVFRSSKPVDHPITGNRMGYKVSVQGVIEIIEVLDKRKSTAVITESFREITRGARIRPHEPFVKEVTEKKGVERVEGFIIETKNHTQLSGKGDVIYMDIGEVHSVVPGNTMSIYTLPRKSYDPDSGKRVTIPGTLIGKVVVLDVDEENSTGIITESSRQIQIGNIVSLDI